MGVFELVWREREIFVFLRERERVFKRERDRFVFLSYSMVEVCIGGSERRRKVRKAEWKSLGK